MTTYYVGSGGNDANSGTSWANRRATVAAGESLCTSPGDVLYVGPGTYSENVTFDNTGASGNPITYVGDYSGANTDGVGGVVTLNGIYIVTAAYQVFRGFSVSSTNVTGSIQIQAGNTTVENCYIINNTTSAAGIYVGSGATAMDNTTIRRCFVTPLAGVGIRFRPTADDAGAVGNVVENCIIAGAASNGGTGVVVDNQGGVTIRNCLLWGTGDYGIRAVSLPTGESITVNNCILTGIRFPLHASASGELVENYNNISESSTHRTNVTTGANSTTHPMPLDRRWFFEAVGGGSMVTPFDLMAGSPLVELNSGTGAPAADMRGATVIGTYREWGPLEYDAALDIEPGSGGGGEPVVGNLTNVGENAALAGLTTTTLYVALFSAAPGEAGGGTELSGDGYARAPVSAWDAPVDGATANSANIEFNAATGNWTAATHIALFDAASGGDMWMYGELDSPVTVESGDACQFTAGSLVLQMD